MRLVTDEYSKAVLLLVCLIKVYHDAGIDIFERGYEKELIDMDYYYDYIMEAISNAAPKTVTGERLYNKFGYDEDDCEVYVWAYSSDEFEEYFIDLAR